MTPLALIATALLVAAPPGPAPRPKATTVPELISSMAPRWWTPERREAHGRDLFARIVIEGKRRNLSVAALTAIAWIESGFNPYVRGKATPRRAGELGVWQLILHDSYVEEARKALAGCRPPKKLPARLHPLWMRRAEGASCEDQAVADYRTWHGPFLGSELVDTVLSTYIAAFEIRRHLDKAKESRLRFSAPRECAGLPPDLPLLAKFNSGPAPIQMPYVRKLCRLYRTVSELLPPGSK